MSIQSIEPIPMEDAEQRGNEAVPLLNIPISRRSIQEAIVYTESLQASRAGGVLCFVNVHTLTESRYNPLLNAALSHSHLNLADGMPLVWLSRAKGSPIRSRVCGPDFMKTYLERNSGSLHGFIGGLPGTAEQIAQRFQLKAVCFSPPMRSFSEATATEDWKAFLKVCPDQEPPPIVWVGLGAPKQELWMDCVSKLSPKTLFLGVGAAFDFLSLRKKRAPLWVQKSGFEWAYRLISEPRRLWRRYFVTNLLFLQYALRDLLSLL